VVIIEGLTRTQDMILQVLALTPDKIAALPAAERDAIQQLVSDLILLHDHFLKVFA
jgi:hypothetical protein